VKKAFIILVIFISLTAFAFAAGGKVRGEKGQGITGTKGKGATTQTRGK